ncbi:MAG: exodeoxyribonuclease VII small subunit [Ruminococcaceae bacterium]|nr:exodeoxyribonuclease VII small subunit [Oscillospiraceae bacterium]
MPQRKSSKTEELKFEDALNRIQEINLILSKGECGLDEALELFSEGTKLAELCSDRIKNAKQRIQMVTEVDEDEDVE